MLQLLLPPCPHRLFEYRGRVSPVPRVVPVKRPRVTIPLVRRVKATLPVKLFARSAAIANSSAKLKCECVHAAPGLLLPSTTQPPASSLAPTGLGAPRAKPAKPQHTCNQQHREGFSEAHELQMRQGKV